VTTTYDDPGLTEALLAVPISIEAAELAELTRTAVSAGRRLRQRRRRARTTGTLGTAGLVAALAVGLSVGGRTGAPAQLLQGPAPALRGENAIGPVPAPAAMPVPPTPATARSASAAPVRWVPLPGEVLLGDPATVATRGGQVLIAYAYAYVVRPPGARHESWACLAVLPLGGTDLTQTTARSCAGPAAPQLGAAESVELVPAGPSDPDNGQAGFSPFTDIDVHPVSRAVARVERVFRDGTRAHGRLLPDAPGRTVRFAVLPLQHGLTGHDVLYDACDQVLQDRTGDGNTDGVTRPTPRCHTSVPRSARTAAASAPGH